MSDTEPTIVRKLAIDCTPHRHGIWCSVGGGKPFANPIVNRGWCKDGRISMMLDSHNFFFALPDEEIDVVEMSPVYGAKLMADVERKDDAKMAEQWPPCACTKSGLPRGYVPDCGYCAEHEPPGATRRRPWE